jgi:hypothetical protein
VNALKIRNVHEQQIFEHKQKEKRLSEQKRLDHEESLQNQNAFERDKIRRIEFTKKRRQHELASDYKTKMLSKSNQKKANDLQKFDDLDAERQKF